MVTYLKQNKITPKLIRALATLGIVALLSAGVFVTPVYAIAPPDSLQINSVYAYQHCLETDDQLYLVQYTIYYAPEGEESTNPDENVTEAYLVRFMDGAAELKSVAPYAYYDDGYGDGIAAIYFSASDPNLPTWEGAYTIKLEGNPTLAWDPDIPSTSVAAFDLWSSSASITETQDELTARILYLADQLELEWGISMIDTTGTGSYLSGYGEAYFTSAIPNIKAMAPNAFAGGTSSPDWSAKEPITDYAEDRAHSTDGTLLDVTAIAEWWGVSRMWTSSLLFVCGAVFILYTMLSPSGNYRPLVFLSIPLFIAGGYLGMIPMLFTVLIGFFAFALSLWLMFYHPSSA